MKWPDDADPKGSRPSPATTIPANWSSGTFRQNEIPRTNRPPSPPSMAPERGRPCRALSKCGQNAARGGVRLCALPRPNKRSGDQAARTPLRRPSEGEGILAGEQLLPHLQRLRSAGHISPHASGILQFVLRHIAISVRQNVRLRQGRAGRSALTSWAIHKSGSGVSPLFACSTASHSGGPAATI